ncbi:MAG: LuxR C-terminal-related transcriptional regulator [Bacillota bacterium]
MSPFPKDPGPTDYGAYLCSPTELKASHERCRALKVPVALARPRHVLPPDELEPRLRANAALVALAECLIDPVCCTGPQKHYIYILCDPELAVLKIFAAPEVLIAAEEDGVKPGTVFTEESCGTNALALAQEHKRVRAIRGEQHYCKLFKDWWCVAGPVKDPGGKILGYLDISMHAGKELGLATAHLQALVNLIEKELYLRELEGKLQQTGVRLAPILALPPEVERELTPREREVLTLLCYRLTSKEIAERLHLSPSTVETYRKHIYQKLGVKGRVGLFSILDR